MSYTAPDLADDVEKLLREAGYGFDSPLPYQMGGDPDAGHWWTFGGEQLSSEPNETAQGSVMDALMDMRRRMLELQEAAAMVLATWEHGDLAEAVRELQASLEAAVPGDVDDYVASIVVQKVPQG